MRYTKWLLVVAVLAYRTQAQYHHRGNAFYASTPQATGQGLLRPSADQPSPGFSGVKDMTMAVAGAAADSNPAPPQDKAPDAPTPQEIPKYQDSPFQYQRDYHPPALPFPRYNFGGPPFFNTFNRPGGFISTPSNFGFDYSFPGSPAQFPNNGFGYFNSDPQSYHIRREYDNHWCNPSQEEKDKEQGVTTTVQPPTQQPNFHQQFDAGPNGFSQGQGSNLVEERLLRDQYGYSRDRHQN